MYSLRVDEDVELVLPLLSDAAAVFSLVDGERERLRSWLSWVDEIHSVQDQERGLRKMREDAGAGRSYTSMIRVDGEPAGFLGLHLDAVGVGGEIGYWLAKRYEGRGVVTRGVAVVLDAAFHRLSLNRVTIRVAPGNERSRAVPQRLGFQSEGRQRGAERTADGEYRDLELWSMLANEWPASRSTGKQQHTTSASV